MKRLIVYTYTGAAATNLIVARRLSRKMLGAQGMGHCVLVDFEEVEASWEFLEVLLKGLRPDKVKFCGLPIMTHGKLSLNHPMREERR